MSKCAIEGCESPVRYVGLCGKHYKRKWRHGSPNITMINMTGIRSHCHVEECEREVRYPSTGLCHPHHILWTRHGRLHNIRAASGEGRPKTAAGYVMLTREGRKVYEHIWLAEKALGKRLPPKAIVHHMNGDPADNFTPFNLVICPNQAYHLLLHRRAKELELYGRCIST